VLTAAGLGLLLGIRHAADPDHLAAVSAIAARQGSRGRTAAVGLAWGLGHALVVVTAGALLVLLGQNVPGGVASAMEAGVGLVLIGLGVGNLRGARAAATARAPWGGWRSFAVGAVHGLAGTAGLALLALTAMPTPAAAVAYLAVFGLGSLLGMLAVSLGLGVPLGWAAARPRGPEVLSLATGLLAVACGGWLVWAGGSALG
jgi:hypothetical protein